MVKKYNRFPEIKRMWGRAESALANASAITIFGFSFPTSDCIICEMFRATLRHASRLKDILIIDVEPERVGERMQALLSGPDDVHIHTFAVPRDGSVPTWLA
jgi:hypothetical protein